MRRAAIRGRIVTMDGKPMALAWWVADEIAGDDPLRYIKQRAADHLAAAEMLGQAARTGTVAARADRLDPAAALAADEAFTTDEVKEMWQSSGLSSDDLDAAANVALELWKIEQQRR
jgi:hypothetical protein